MRYRQRNVHTLFVSLSANRSLNHLTQTVPAQPPISPYVFEAADNRVQRTPYGHVRHALRYKNFFFYWVRRSLVTRYRQTSLGWFWALLQPLLTSVIYVIIFSVILKVPTGDVPYPLFIVTNLVFWTYFSRVVIAGAGSVTGNIDLLTRIQFPREFLPLGIWVESTVDLIIGLFVVALFFAGFHYPITINFFAVVPALLVETMLALGLAFLTAAMSVIVRDLMQLIPLVMPLLMYVTPVIYPLKNVPDSIKGVYLLNPLGAIFATIQDALYSTPFTALPALAATAVFALIILIGSYMIFKRAEWQFADLL
jgi:ABC-type polysaccharide/polyol phosphate export permease